MEKPIWYKQSGFRFTHMERNVYIDPWEVPEGEPAADFILITHAHFDHFDKDTIEQLRHKQTIIVAPHDVARELSGERIIGVSPGERREIEGLKLEMVPAYNIGKDAHPKEKNWVGYIAEINGTRYYHAGDTDRIPEMGDIDTVVAMLPIGGTYTMNVDEAVLALENIGPQVGIPMHYGFVVGEQSDGERFRERAEVPVELLVPEIPFGI